MAVFRTCIRLGVPEEALKLATEKVKYGLFPMKNATHELLMTFVEAQNIEGTQSCDCHVTSSTRVEVRHRQCPVELEARVLEGADICQRLPKWRC